MLSNFFLHPPEPLHESRSTSDRCRVPCGRILERAHEHLVNTKCIGAVFRNDIIWIDDVPVTFAHLPPVFGEDETEEFESSKWLLSAHDANVVEKFMPETSIDEMTHGMVATHIHINRRPVFFIFRRDKLSVVMRIHEAQVVP